MSLQEAVRGHTLSDDFMTAPHYVYTFAATMKIALGLHIEETNGHTHDLNSEQYAPVRDTILKQLGTSQSAQILRDRVTEKGYPKTFNELLTSICQVGAQMCQALRW